MWNAKWPLKIHDTRNTSMESFQEAETKQHHALHVKHGIHGVRRHHVVTETQHEQQNVGTEMPNENKSF